MTHPHGPEVNPLAGSKGLEVPGRVAPPDLSADAEVLGLLYAYQDLKRQNRELRAALALSTQTVAELAGRLR